MVKLQARTARVVSDVTRAYLEERITAAGFPDPSPLLDKYTRPDFPAFTKRALFKQLIDSSSNRQMGRNVIARNLDERFLRDFVFDYDPTAVLSHWSNEGTERFHGALVDTGIAHPKRRGAKWTYWEVFASSVLEAAFFVSELDIEEFRTAIRNGGWLSELGAINLIASSIRGFGIALAADALKELGIVDTVKPDVHILKLGELLGSKTLTPAKILVAMNKLTRTADVSAYEMDKLVWLVFSGDFYLADQETRRRMKSLVSRADWEQRIVARLAKPDKLGLGQPC